MGSIWFDESRPVGPSEFELDRTNFKNVYVSPGVKEYLERFEEAIESAGLQLIVVGTAIDSMTAAFSGFHTNGGAADIEFDDGKIKSVHPRINNTGPRPRTAFSRNGKKRY